MQRWLFNQQRSDEDKMLQLPGECQKVELSRPRYRKVICLFRGSLVRRPFAWRVIDFFNTHFFSMGASRTAFRCC